MYLRLFFNINRTHLKYLFSDLRLINIKTALNTLKECKTIPQNVSKQNVDIVSKCKAITFSPRSIGFEIKDESTISRIKQDPLTYTPIINPRSILPIIDANWRKDEIGLPPIVQEEKHAVRLIVIRRKKMKKHQRNKLWKRMRHRWARVSFKKICMRHNKVDFTAEIVPVQLRRYCAFNKKAE